MVVHQGSLDRGRTIALEYQRISTLTPKQGEKTLKT